MKFVRKFSDTETRDEVLAIVDYEVLSYTEGAGINIKPEESEPVIDSSTPFYIDVRGPVTLFRTSDLQMSTDKTNWTDIADNIVLQTGKTYFRVKGYQYYPVKPNWGENDSSDYDIGGNINSLAKVDFENDTTCYSFGDLFYEKTKLKSVSNLLLPAITLTNSCYGNMFDGCTSLTAAPALPATTLARACYEAMFAHCPSLTAAPALPATTLVDYCYDNMFFGCSSLITAPDLPATTLVDYCYDSMFIGCTNLNYIKCLATDISASNCTHDWVNGVSSTGTFVKDPNMSSWTTGDDGIPSGWTVQDAA